MAADSDIRVHVRVLPGEVAGVPRVMPGADTIVGVLDRIEGTRLTILCDESGSFPLGTLVEVDTPDRVYLGQVKYYVSGKMLVDFEHELDKSALDKIHEIWR